MRTMHYIATSFFVNFVHKGTQIQMKGSKCLHHNQHYSMTVFYEKIGQDKARITLIMTCAHRLTYNNNKSAYDCATFEQP